MSIAYLLLQIVLTKENSTNDPMMKVVQTMNHTSLALLYDTLGIALSVWDERVMNVNIVLMPGKILILLLLEFLFATKALKINPFLCTLNHRFTEYIP
jgi:hypothetical protein